jgi:NADH-quinone oxidoreductase subunit G
MIAEPRKNYLLLGIEPELDCGDGEKALAAMRHAGFVVALTPFVTERMRDYADVLLPVNTFAETSGTFVNCEGRWQSFAAAARAPGASRPAWKVLRVLGNLLELDGFEQDSSEQVRDELAAKLKEVTVNNTRCGAAVGAVASGDGLQRIAWLPMYASDAIVRRAGALQQTHNAEVARVCLNPADAGSLGLADSDQVFLHQGGQTAELDLRVTAQVAPGAALIPTGIEATFELGAPHGTVKLKKV